ncbi:hypothetical protein CBR_g39290 [Chara braunii]|uniref:Uncharacterized protein n=1 Tax=Chara braunii TaxID=69332 RepID=A0A388K132_CHABU|nr:hypothetical protein CBR_g39290 [Chara braunii]|eukprot:GBG63746.1 hypothetical protein CBR_g39290 [Chara braunii]
MFKRRSTLVLHISRSIVETESESSPTHGHDRTRPRPGGNIGEDDDDPGYSLTCRHGDDDDKGGDGTQPAGGLQRSERHRGDRCSGAGRGGIGPGVGGAGHTVSDTGGADRAARGRGRQEYASFTRTVHWDDEGAATTQVAAASAEVAASPAEFTEVAAGFVEVAAASTEVAVGSAKVVAASANAVAASAEIAVGSAEVGGAATEVGRASAQLSATFSDDMFGASLGPPPTPIGERGSGGVDAQATPISQILRGLPSCGVGGINSSMLREERVPESKQEKTGREERERALELARRCEMTQTIAARARVERMLETGDGAGHCTTEDAEVECGGVVSGDAGERPASSVHGVCVLPFVGALSAGELERQTREDPLRADRRGRMDEASRRVMAEGPAYVPCSPSVPSSTTNAILPTHVEGLGTTPSPSSAPGGESPSPKSRKKKMRAGKSLSTMRRVTHQMRASQPGLADLHPHTRETLCRDVVADAIGWWERASNRGTEQTMSAPAEAAVPRPGGRTSTTAREEHDERHRHPSAGSRVPTIWRCLSASGRGFPYRLIRPSSSTERGRGDITGRDSCSGHGAQAGRWHRWRGWYH